MTRRESRVRPHLFQPDPDIPARHDAEGHVLNLGACRRCGLVGEAGDAHHPETGPAGLDVQQLRAGENGDEA